MIFDKKECLNVCKKFTKKSPVLQNLSKKDITYINRKCLELSALIEELNNKSLIKHLNKNTINEIREIYKNNLVNLGQINSLQVLFIKLIQNCKSSGSITHINLKDDDLNLYQLSLHNIVILIGLFYSLRYELILSYLKNILDFNALGVRIPNGLGQLKKNLKDKNLNNLDFFKDINSSIRNSFIHLNFKLYGDNVYIYDKNNNPKVISLGELFKASLDIDRIDTAVMAVVEYFIEKNK